MATVTATQHNLGQELLDVPMGEMISSMALAIAGAQFELDSCSIRVAQMLGGLETITKVINGKEQVTFKDSRVFFGKEKLSVSSAIQIHNSTSDTEYKERIKEALGTANYDPDGATGNIKAKSTTGAGDKIVYIPSRVSMLELGFTPTFYQFVDTIIEVKINITITENSANSESSGSYSRSGSGEGLKRLFGGNSRVNTSHTNAYCSQKYSYNAEGSSLLRTKLVPIPPPAILDERIRHLMQLMDEEKQAQA